MSKKKKNQEPEAETLLNANQQLGMILGYHPLPVILGGAVQAINSFLTLAEANAGMTNQDKAGVNMFVANVLGSLAGQYAERAKELTGEVVDKSL